MKYIINGQRKKLSEMTVDELSKTFDIEAAKTEACWKFWKPFYIVLSVCYGLLYLYLIIDIIIMLW